MNMTDLDELKIILGGMLKLVYPEKMQIIQDNIIEIYKMAHAAMKKSNISDSPDNIIDALLNTMSKMIKIEIESEKYNKE